MPNEYQKVSQSKGRPLLQWVGKKPLEGVEYYPAQEKEVYGDKDAKDFNKLFWGDNLQVLSHLLKEYRGKVDLIYIDPPFDSKADYVKKVKVKGEQIEGEAQSVIEEAQYTDIWEKDEYLQFMYERLLIMKELLSDGGSIYLHCDWHKSGYLRLIMDEVFGADNFVNEIIWKYTGGTDKAEAFLKKHDNIYFYKKNEGIRFNVQFEDFSEGTIRRFNKTDENGRKYKENRLSDGRVYRTYMKEEGKVMSDVWEDEIIEQNIVVSSHNESVEYPTQKPEVLIEKIIKASSKEGDIVADFFLGSGTTCAVAQRLGRKWLGCDINLGAIQTTTKRLNQVVAEQQKENPKDFKGSLGFKVLNVNNYDVFKNELEAKEIVMEMYGVEPLKRTYFDGFLDNHFVKVLPLNRVLNKMDVRSLLKNIAEKVGDFTVKKTSSSSEAVYEQGVLVICSGMELDVLDFLKKENRTGVKIDIRDIQTDKKGLIFKQKPEAKVAVKVNGKKLLAAIQEFHSPILMRKLQLENEKMLKADEKAKVEDFRQVIDSVAIDTDYDGKLFNAEVMDFPTKKEVIKAEYEWEYEKGGKNTVAVKIVDVLGEEYFETFEVEVK